MQCITVYRTKGCSTHWLLDRTRLHLNYFEIIFSRNSLFTTNLDQSKTGHMEGIAC